MQLFYNPDINEETTDFSFEKEESRHIVKVLRKRVNDHLHLTNGNGWLFKAKLINADIKQCLATIIDKEKQEKHPYNLHLAVAPTKMNDRYEWFLEKATEIGVDSITPLICEHSERTVVKLERFEKIVLSAMKQSLQCHLPKLNTPVAFKDFITQKFSGQLFIAHCEATERKSLKNELKSKQDVTILIGPEGDFSVSEIQLALRHKYIPVTLGFTRLRTETAAITACHSVAFMNETYEN